MNVTGKYQKHGLTHSKVRNVWRHMLRRCYQPNHKSYRWYGARGVMVCERWKDLENFVADMGHPEEGMTLDRIDSNGNYEPKNCRWIPLAEQARNRTNNRYLEFRGQRKLISEWAREFGIKHSTLTQRLSAGLSVDSALTKPIGRWA